MTQVIAESADVSSALSAKRERSVIATTALPALASSIRPKQKATLTAEDCRRGDPQDGANYEETKDDSPSRARRQFRDLS
jgi:hypothetical protein